MKTEHTFYGLYRGVVKDNNDPQNQRRLKVTVPQVTGAEVHDWAWPVEPSSVHTSVPVIGQGVWVAFIGGKPGYPIWIGASGKNQGTNKQVYIKPLDNKVSTTGYTNVLKINSLPDGTKELDLVDSLVALATTATRFVTAAPTSHTSTGKKGDMFIGTVGLTTYVYICKSDNSWVRIGADASF